MAATALKKLAGPLPLVQRPYTLDNDQGAKALANKTGCAVGDGSLGASRAGKARSGFFRGSDFRFPLRCVFEKGPLP